MHKLATCTTCSPFHLKTLQSESLILSEIKHLQAVMQREKSDLARDRTHPSFYAVPAQSYFGDDSINLNKQSLRNDFAIIYSICQWTFF